MMADLTAEVMTGCKREENPKGLWEGITLIRRSLDYCLSPMWQRKRSKKHSLFGPTFWTWTEIKKSPKLK